MWSELLWSGRKENIWGLVIGAVWFIYLLAVVKTVEGMTGAVMGFVTDNKC